MSKTILFVDGENFLYKIKTVLQSREQTKRVTIDEIDFDKLFEMPLGSLKIDRKIFYAGRLHIHPSTPQKSQQLIKLQRKLRNTLVNQGFEFVLGGNVRGQKVDRKTIFKEKGVDVKIAVDLVSLACDKKIKVAILCSSDSDLQPAIKEARERNVEIVYLGFEMKPNKGLTYTTNRTLLFRNAEIVDSVSKHKLKEKPKGSRRRRASLRK